MSVHLCNLGTCMSIISSLMLLFCTGHFERKQEVGNRFTTSQLPGGIQLASVVLFGQRHLIPQ